MRSNLFIPRRNDGDWDEAERNQIIDSLNEKEEKGVINIGMDIFIWNANWYGNWSGIHSGCIKVIVARGKQR